MGGWLILAKNPESPMRNKFVITASLFLSGVFLPPPASAQWTNHYPLAEGFNHHVYLEGFELPVLNAGPMDPAPSPAGDAIAFSAKGWIWLMDLETGRAKRLTRSGGMDSRPEWSPSGEDLVFIRDSGSQLSIVLLNLESATERVLVDVEAINLDPVFSPDEAFVYYASSESGKIELWRVALDSRTREQVTPKGQEMRRPIKRRPLLLGDDSLILYLNKLGTTDSIELYNTLTQTSERLLTDRLAAQADMAVSPDGKYLAYTWPFDGGYELRMLFLDEPDTSVQLTQSLGQPLAPAFSHDGKWVYFAEYNDDERSELKRISIYGGTVETAAVNEWAWGEDSGSLVIDSRVNGEPAAVRMSVLDAAGHPVLPETGAVHAEGQNGRVFFYSDGQIELIAPAGRVSISAVHGFETPERTEQATVKANATTNVKLDLERIWDASGSGWYSGDNHFHLNYGGTSRLTPGDLILPMQGEALDVATPLLANLHNRFLEQNLWGWSRTEAPIILFGQEVRSHFLGHIELIGTDELFWPWVWGPGYELYRSDDRINAEALRFARDQGGLGGYVHPVAVEDPFTPENYDEVPIGFIADAVLGEVDLIELACLWTDEVGTGALWHAVLNLGIPLAASGGSDVMMDYYRTMAVGSTRVYVKPAGDLTPASYLQAVKQGRSFISNGPMLEFEVNGMGPGNAVDVSKGSVNWTLNVHSALPLDSLEIIVNGAVVDKQAGLTEAGSKRYSGTLEVPSGGWVTARVLGPDGGWPGLDSYLFAETSPVWLGQVGSTDPDAVRQSAEQLLVLLDEAEKEMRTGYGEQPIPILLGHFQKARVRLQEMAAGEQD
jgi:TolB protein